MGRCSVGGRPVRAEPSRHRSQALSPRPQANARYTAANVPHYRAQDSKRDARRPKGRQRHPRDPSSSARTTRPSEGSWMHEVAGRSGDSTYVRTLPARGLRRRETREHIGASGARARERPPGAPGPPTSKTPEYRDRRRRSQARPCPCPREATDPSRTDQPARRQRPAHHAAAHARDRTRSRSR